MVLDFLKKLNERIKNIIGTIMGILIITVIASLVLCLIFASIGHFASLSFMTSLAGICFLTFLITAGVLITVAIILLICLIVDAIKRDGLKKLLKRIIPTFAASFIILIVIHFIKDKKLEYIESLFYSLLITLSPFFCAEIGMLKKEMEPSSDENDSK